MTALEYLKYLRDTPHIYLPCPPHVRTELPSNSELRRWLTSGSVLINEGALRPDDAVTEPIWRLIFFPKGKYRTTWLEPKASPQAMAWLRKLR